ncbi:hypothetical protein COL940_004648 [Colletotrichum noveboracense]|nr:hypothetical protein COL940_004648 [Colletotrichum noveboracense]KAJ0290662.1 hypothetical protein CBS470a_003837 [Colletotrichum nupharicola]
MAEFFGLLHPTKPLRLSGRQDLVVDFCKAILEANSPSSVEEELRDENTLSLTSHEDARSSGLWKPVKLKHQGEKGDIVYKPFVHTESLEFNNAGAIDYYKSLYAALGLDYDPKVARGIHKLWTSLKMAHNDPAASYRILLEDFVGSDVQKIRILVKLARALNINTAKEVHVVAELARDMHNTDADEMKEPRELLHSLGTRDPEDLRALRQLSKENKTIDATELRKLREEQKIAQEAQNVEEEDEDQTFVDPSDSSRHASA